MPAGEGGAPSEELPRRFEEELREMAEDYLAKEEEFKKRIIGLEQEVGKYKIEDKVRAEAKAFEGKPKSEVQAAFSRKEQEVLHKEKMVLMREQELQRLQADLQVKEDEIKKVKEPLTYKEEELLRREEDLMYREEVLQAEHRKVEEAKAQGGSVEELDLKSRLEELKSTITTKEEEVRTKERYLQQKMEELRLREQGLISEDIEARDKDLQVEVKQQKVKMGIPRLDDLLFGGIPFVTNASVYGPAYVGKEVLVSLFMAEGLEKGVSVLCVLTDKGPADVREEMAFALPGYEEYEKLGLVRYIDAYSKSMGADASDPNTTYIDEPTDHQAILKAVDARAAGWEKKYATYRLAIRSVSTLIAYLDPTTTFKFLQPFVGRRKRDKAVAFYVIEKGMHEEQEVQMLGSLMDGSIEFKVEQLKSFLSIKGICDVQSRGWIRYTYSKSSLSIGSFSLDHIKRSGDLRGTTFPGFGGWLRDVHLRDRDRRWEPEFPREDDRLRDAVRHDHGVNLLGDLGRHLAPGGPAFHERPRVAFPEQIPFDLDEADDGLGGVVVRGEAEVDRGLAVPEFGDEGDGTVVVHSQVQPAVRRLHEAAAVHTGEFERLDRHRFAASNEPTLFECSGKRGF